MSTACLQAWTPIVKTPLGVLATLTRSVYTKPFTYHDKYYGLFDNHDHEKYPRKMGKYKEEELLDEIHTIRGKSTTNPSPFHIITRIKGAHERLPWMEKVTLRRLNIHSSRNGDVTIVPNTPQFNELINKVKHLIALKPAVFADGKVPRKEDIGALRICQWTGTVKVDEKLRLRSKRLGHEMPLLYQGNHLRAHIAKKIGIHGNHFIR